MTRLIAESGVAVDVPDEKVASLLAQGFRRPAPKAPAKKAASSKSEKSD